MKQMLMLQMKVGLGVIRQLEGVAAGWLLHLDSLVERVDPPSYQHVFFLKGHNFPTFTLTLTGSGVDVECGMIVFLGEFSSIKKGQ